MNKFLQIFLYIFLIFWSVTSTFAQQKVEDIFMDINKNFEYKKELQYLFDQGFIQTNNFNTFSPNNSITREEFLGLLLETNCQKCIKPNTNLDLLSTYSWKDVYYDVNNKSDYFYCIAYWDDKNYIQWYEKNTTCENWTSSSQAPFCPYNPITNQEALAIIMRTSWLLTQQSADNIIQEIYQWKDFPDLSNDMSPKFPNGEINNFYPYYLTAENISHTDIDIYWNIQEYFLLEKKWGNYFPQAALSKKQMLSFAYFSHKNSQCTQQEYNISGSIDIKNGNCSAGETCNLPANFQVNNQIDFEWIFDTTQIIEMQDADYTWVIHNLDDNSETIYTGKYLDNIDFPKSWDYRVDLFVKDALGNTGKFSQDFTITQENNNFLEWYISYDQNIDSSEIDFNSDVSGNNGPFEYLWDFGDGNTSNEKNPNHNYSENWNYNVKLTVKDSVWNQENFYTQVQINNQQSDNGFPNVDLIIIWENNIANFDADNIQADNYYWDFGDGNTSNQKNPNHTYSQAGDYEVILVIENSQWSSSFDLQVHIPENDDDLAGYMDISIDSKQDNSYDFSTEIISWEWPFEYIWDFGDGNTSTQQNPNHQFTTTGKQNISVIITDKNGNTSESTNTIWIVNMWDSLQALVENTNDPLTFDFNSINTSNNPENQYLWDFWDGNTSSEKNPTHTYNQPGEYEVTVTVSNWDWVKKIDLIVIVPENNFQLEADAKIISQNLITNNYKFGAEIISWEWPFEYLWDFGDGTTSTQKNPNHTFQGDGPHQITVLITDKFGNKIIKNLVLYPDYSDLSIGLDIQNQENNSYDFSAEIISWEWPFEYLWDFGDGNTSTQKNPNHTFEFNWEYWVELHVIDKFWNIKKQFTTIIISSQQDNDFNINISANPSSWNAPLVTDFSSIIIWNQNEQYQYSWDFGDGNTQNGKNVTHTFYNNWSYIVTLLVTNSANKTVEKTMIITVLNQKEIDEIGNDNIPVSDSDNDGVNDDEDRCIDLPWDPKNKWCPIFDISCESDSDCPNSSKCASNLQWEKTCIAIEKQVVCNDSNQGTIQGNVVCTTCPCQNTLNFKAQLRACDVIFPAIVSPDGKDIYSKWKYFQVQ